MQKSFTAPERENVMKFGLTTKAAHLPTLRTLKRAIARNNTRAPGRVCSMRTYRYVECSRVGGAAAC